jgi:hypothetical protein
LGCPDLCVQRQPRIQQQRRCHLHRHVDHPLLSNRCAAASHT